MNKYNEFMSHIRVDDEMHRRIMDAVSSALDEKETVTELPVRRKAKVALARKLAVTMLAMTRSGEDYRDTSAPEHGAPDSASAAGGRSSVRAGRASRGKKA